MRSRSWLMVATVVAIVAGCGGSDDEPASATTTERPAVVDPSDEDSSTPTSPPPDDEGTDTERTDTEAPPAANGDLSCDDVFSVDEIADFVGEPVELVPTSDAALGSITCAWDSVEDPDDTADLAFTGVFAQIFTGDPVPAANFIDPTVFDEVTMIDDVGDVAFFEESFGTTFYVLDGDVAGVFSYTDADFGDPEAPTRRSFDEVLELFREFHRRIT